jgi:hypothetical protein
MTKRRALLEGIELNYTLPRELTGEPPPPRPPFPKDVVRAVGPVMLWNAGYSEEEIKKWFPQYVRKKKPE